MRRRAGFFSKSDIKKNYTIGDQLGSGNFAVVRKGQKNPKHQQGAAIPTDIAIKIIDKAKVEDMGDIQREIEIMQMIDHKNVIKLFEIYDEPKKASAARHATRRAAPAPPPPLPPPPAPPPLSARPLAL